MRRINLYKLLGVIGLSVGLLGLNASAATLAQFNYSLYNTGQTYNVDHNSYNNKTYASDPWTLSVGAVATGSSSPYGIHFIPYISGNGPCYGSGVWRKTNQSADRTGRIYTYYAPAYQYTGGRYLSARIDDSYYPSSPWYSYGWWNADQVLH